MNSLKLYVVKYWMPFPSSEYGGIQGYVAESRKELRKMIVEDIEDYGYDGKPDMEEVIDDIIHDAKVFPLSDTMTTGKQFEFLT